MKFQKTFKALSDQTRRDILNLLKDGPVTAGEIGDHFSVSGATISHHLSILKDAGYELNMSGVDDLIGWFSGLKGERGHE